MTALTLLLPRYGPISGVSIFFSEGWGGGGSQIRIFDTLMDCAPALLQETFLHSILTVSQFAPIIKALRINDETCLKTLTKKVL